jgi:hypothetical protein
MKYFEVKFESTNWCGVWDNYLVTTPDNYTEEDVASNEIVLEAADDWMLENNHNDSGDEDIEEDIATVSVSEIEAEYALKMYPDVFIVL